MVGIYRAIETFLKFRLDTVPQYWVSDICEKNLDVETLPLPFEQVHEQTSWTELLAEAILHVKKCTAPDPRQETPSSGSSDGEHTFWASALKRGMNSKTIIAVLGFFIDKGQKSDANLTETLCGLQAAHLYISLLCLPDSNAYLVFNDVVYEKALNSTKIIKVINRMDSKSVPGKGNRTKKPNAKRTRKTLSQTSASSIDEDLEVQDDTWSEKGLTRTAEELLSFTRDMSSFLETYSLRSHARLRELTVEKLCMLVMESDNSCRKALLDSASSAFDALAASCKPLHGRVDRSVGVIMQNLLDVILTGALASKTLKLILHMMSEVGDDAVEGVKTLVQNICIRVPDRAEGRARVAIYVVTLMSHLPVATYAALIKWLRDSYMWNIRVSYRMLVVELFAKLLSQPQKEPNDGNVPKNLLIYLHHNTLLATIIRRCQDKAATVRSKALSVFGDCLVSTNRHVAKAVEVILRLERTTTPIVSTVVVPSPVAGLHVSDTGTTTVPSPSLVMVTPVQSQAHVSNVSSQPLGLTVESLPSSSTKDLSVRTDDNTLVALLAQEPPAESEDPILPRYAEIMNMLANRAAEEKVNVRKIALQVLEIILKMNVASLTKENLLILQKHCRDPSLMVRKQMAVSLTSLLQRYPQVEMVQQSLLRGVFPLIVDCESTVQEKCLELLDTLLLQNIKPYTDNMSASQAMTWQIFRKLTDEEHRSFPYFRKVLTKWKHQGKVNVHLFKNIVTHIETANNDAAWLLLATIANMVAIKDVSFASSYWTRHFKDEERNYIILEQALSVLADFADFVSGERDEMLVEMQDSVANFDCPFELVSPMVTTVIKLNQAKTRNSRRDAARVWGSEVLKKASQNLSRVILNEKYRMTDADEITILRQLHTLSEICIKCQLQPPQRVILSIESLLASRKIEVNESYLSTESLNPLNESVARPRIRSQAFVTLGKLCLKDDALAKQCVAAFATELETTTDPVIRKNIVIIFGDLCRRYATLVDPHLSTLTACLRDPHLIVRYQTNIVLTKLLREEYIKWKEFLFFRMVITMVDEDEEIRLLANHCLAEILMSKHPHLMFQHFVECVFHFNSYQKHATYNKFVQTEREIKLFSLEGKENANKRITLYRYMLQNMDDTSRLRLTARLCQDILGAIVDDIIPLAKESYGILQDTLKILSCEDIKLSSMTAPTQEAVEGGDEEDVMAAAVATVGKNLVTEVVKRNLIENIMPITLALKQKLEQSKSPLLYDLMTFLKEIVKDFRNEVKEVLSVDKQLAKEIEFDLKRFEQESRKVTTTDEEVQNMLDTFHIEPSRHEDEDSPVTDTATALAAGAVTPADGEEANHPVTQETNLEEMQVNEEDVNQPVTQETNLGKTQVNEEDASLPATSDANSKMKKRVKKVATKSCVTTRHDMESRTPVIVLEQLDSRAVERLMESFIELNRSKGDMINNTTPSTSGSARRRSTRIKRKATD